MNDTFNLAYDYQLLGDVFLHSQDYDKASENFNLALNYARNLSRADFLHMQSQLAATEYKRGNTQKALELIQGVIPESSSVNREMALANASTIYLEAGVLDTAYIYAKELTQAEYGDNRRIGYRNLLTPQLFPFSTEDSITSYFQKYKTLLEEYNYKHENQQALIQNAYYNYTFQERKRIEAENRRDRMVLILHLLGTGLLLSIIIIFVLNFRNQKHVRKLQKMQLDLQAFKALINNCGTEININTTDPKALRQQLRAELNELIEQGGKCCVPLDIQESEAYKIIKKAIDENRAIGDNNPIWNDLEETIINCTNNFYKKLRLLVGKDLKPHEMQTVMLLKCGFSPSQIAIVLSKTKGTITNRRDSLCFKIFGEKLGGKDFDRLILLL